MSELTPHTNPDDLTDAHIQGMLAAAAGAHPNENPYILKHPSGAHTQWQQGYTHIRNAISNAYLTGFQHGIQDSAALHPAPPTDTK